MKEMGKYETILKLIYKLEDRNSIEENRKLEILYDALAELSKPIYISSNQD